MISPVVCLLLLLFICLGPQALPASGIAWDWLGGLGLASLAFLLSLSWEAESPAPQPRLTLHRNLAVAASILALAHALGYLITDPITVEYLKPTAPAHMLIGILGLLLTVGVTLTSLPDLRRRIYRRFRDFRHWHLGASIAALITAGWHVVGTGYLISTVWQLSAIVLLAAALPTLAYLSRRHGITTTIGAAPESAGLANRSVLLSGLISILLATVYAVAKNP